MAGFAAIPKVDLAAAAVAQIRDAILSGDIAAGDELRSERELAMQLGINRTTVREVLTRLELLGIIDRQHGKRCRVLDYRRNGSLRLIPHLVQLGIPGTSRSIREATAITYEATAALAAQRRSGQGLAELERAIATLEDAVSGGADEDIIRADREFHHSRRAGGLPRARARRERLLPCLRRIARHRRPDETLHRQPPASHRRKLAAIAAPAPR